MSDISSLPSDQNIVYIPHGGGPMPLLGEPNHRSLVSFLSDFPKSIPKPSAIVVISAHWEARQPTVTSGALPELIYDYFGFPKEAYDIKYPAPGAPDLAEKIYQLLKSEGFDAQKDEHRGFDHGMFVPLKLMYPSADIPCVQLSLVKGLDPEQHLRIGKALSHLRDKNILILGSGMSFHNQQAFMSSNDLTTSKSDAFAEWLLDTLIESELTDEERNNRLMHWDQAPHALFSHPREEHLIPLHVCFGAAMAREQKAKVVFDDMLMKKRIFSFLW